MSEAGKSQPPGQGAARDLDKNPYSEAEERVARFLSERGVGGGGDPIGALLSSYAYLVELRNSQKVKLDKLTAKHGPVDD